MIQRRFIERYAGPRIIARLLRRAFMMVVLLHVVVSASPGQSDVDTVRLRVDEAVDRALKENPGLALERRRIDRAAASRLATGGFFPSYPTLEFERESDAPFGNEGEGSWGVMVSQEIDLGGSSGLRLQEADIAVAQAELHVRSAELILRRDVAVAFADVAAAQDHLGSMAALLGLARRLDTLARQQLAVGEISELDANTIRIERTAVEIEYADLLGSLESRRLTLAGLLGLQPDLLPVAVGSPSVDEVRRHVDSLTRFDPAAIAGGEGVLAGRPELQALEREKERADLRRSLALRRRIPGVTLGVGYRSETSVLDGSDIQGSESIRAGFGRAVSSGSLLGLHAGISLPLPFSSLYDRGDGDLAIAEVERAAADAEYRVLLARLVNELRGARSRARTALSKLLLFGDGIEPLVRRNIDLLERGYVGGELEASEVVVRQESMMRTMRARIDAQQDLDVALADLKFILANQPRNGE